MEKEKVNGLVKWFSELSNKNVNIAGGKGASLAEMYNYKFPIPPGFVVTAQAYEYFVKYTKIQEQILSIINETDVDNTEELEKNAKEIRGIIVKSKIPEELQEEILEAYHFLDINRVGNFSVNESVSDLLKNSYEPPFVAVRSSATAEDLADASFAGQQESFLNVKGDKQLIIKVKQCFASLFTARAIYYRKKKGFDTSKVFLAVVVQKMIDSEKSGVMFSRDPVGNKNNVLIESVWGLGEGIVSGRIKPDSYVVDRESDELKILDRKISEKKVAIVRDSSGSTEIVKLSAERSRRETLTNYEVKRLAEYAKQLEEHYGKPQDIEFAIADNEIYIVQSRPITTLGKEKKESEEIHGKILLSGLGASPGVAFGPVKIIKDLNELSKISKGDVLVTIMTNPDMVVSMQKAAAIVTDEGGVTSHAAIVSREMGIPAVVGTENATTNLYDGQIITVDGNNGKVVEGRGEKKLAEIKRIVPTKIKTIVDLPEYAPRAALSGIKSVGLVRLEGIIASSGKHPLGFVKSGKIKDYVNIIFRGIKEIAEYFEEVWIRASDLRSDEYRNLDGAPKEVEGNPMLGDHGVRFSLRNKEIFEAEIRAIEEVAKHFPNKKFGIMIPQVISVEEVRETKKIVAQIGNQKNVVVGIMVETPAAVQVISNICKEGISFISFGTNDLTQYTLAIDRNNESVQYLFDEMHPAVLNSLKYVIRECKRHGVYTSICGQAGSKEPMIKFLMKEGIDSISVNADAAEKVSKLIFEIESSGEYNYVGEVENLPDFQILSSKGELSEVENFKNEEHKKVQPVFSYKKLENTPMISMKNNSNVDIEEVILKELEAENNLPVNEYYPSFQESKKDIPLLNDAIPVDSELIEEFSKDENLDSKKEWSGEEENKEKLSEEKSESLNNSDEISEKEDENLNNDDEILSEDNEWKEDKVVDVF